MILPTRAPFHAPSPELPLPAGIRPGLLRARAHELCGPSRVALALLLLAGCEGAVLWVAPSWLPDRLHACGLVDYLHPGRLIFAHARRHEDLQWSAEEALRSGAAPMVVVEMPNPPGLTAVRRLHLAAQTGAEAAHHAALGPGPCALILCAGDGGAQGVETRWHMRPTPTPYTLTEDCGTAWVLERRRARTAPVAAWRLTRSASGQTTAQPA
jgi:protein ImuA